MGRIKKTIIARVEQVAEHQFIGSGYANIKVTGLLVLHQAFGIKWYRIKIYCPSVRGILDGQYYTRCTLRAIKSAIRNQLKRIKFERKNECTL